jgi:hypothetical protein
LAQIIFHKGAQPFLLHADRARQAMAGLDLVQHRTIAFQTEIGKTQALVTREAGHFLEKLTLAHRGRGETIAVLGQGGAGIEFWGMGSSFLRCDIGGRLGAPAGFAAPQNFCDLDMAGRSRFGDRNGAVKALFCPAFGTFAYFLCGIGRSAQFRLPGVGGAAITPALGANWM